MLAYEYAVDKLRSSDWVKEKRKQIQEMQYNRGKLSYIDISIPILAGAFAGKYFQMEALIPNIRLIHHFWTVFCRFYVMVSGDPIRYNKDHCTSRNRSCETWGYDTND